ncbi:MAG: hypothetical protein ACLQAH_15335 [Limisphaerales bacterium]
MMAITTSSSIKVKPRRDQRAFVFGKIFARTVSPLLKLALIIRLTKSKLPLHRHQHPHHHPCLPEVFSHGLPSVARTSDKSCSHFHNVHKLVAYPANKLPARQAQACLPPAQNKARSNEKIWPGFTHGLRHRQRARAGFLPPSAEADWEIGALTCNGGFDDSVKPPPAGRAPEQWARLRQPGCYPDGQ